MSNCWVHISIPRQFTGHPWWTKWHWDRFFSQYFGLPLSVAYHAPNGLYSSSAIGNMGKCLQIWSRKSWKEETTWPADTEAYSRPTLQKMTHPYGLYSCFLSQSLLAGFCACCEELAGSIKTVTSWVLDQLSASQIGIRSVPAAQYIRTLPLQAVISYCNKLCVQQTDPVRITLYWDAFT